ncbi:MAG TPA: glycosyltransferase family 4 protein, partial [Leptolinea sp.]
GILIVSGAKGDTRRYRTLHLHQQLRLAGVESVISHITNPHLPYLVGQARVLILHRVIFTPFIEKIINQIRFTQGLVLVDTDDLIFDSSAFEWIDSPDFQDPIRADLYQDEMRRHGQTLQACDGVIAATDFLAERVRSMGKPAWVHRNAANLELMELSELARLQRQPSTGKIVIGYASGTPTHNRDFSLAAPMLMNFMDTHPEVELRIIGFVDLGQDWSRYKNRVVRFKSVPWQKLPFWLAQLDINLAPLTSDNPFSQSKSEIKYLEAALVGVPTLASAAGSYSVAIRSGENGLLAVNPQEWRVQLEKLLDPEIRHRLAQNALKDAREGYSPLTRAYQAHDLLNEISKAAKRSFFWPENFRIPGNQNHLWWDPEVERHPTEIEMGLYTLRSRGPGILLKQIWIYYRRWLSRYIPYGLKLKT